MNKFNIRELFANNIWTVASVSLIALVGVHCLSGKTIIPISTLFHPQPPSNHAHRRHFSYIQISDKLRLVPLPRHSYSPPKIPVCQSGPRDHRSHYIYMFMYIYIYYILFQTIIPEFDRNKSWLRKPLSPRVNHFDWWPEGRNRLFLSTKK